MKPELGRVMINLGELTYGGLVLGAILQGSFPKFIVLVSGSIIAACFIIAGLFFVKRQEKS